MRALWQPTPAAIEGSRLTAFTRYAAAATGREFVDYAALHRWSVASPEQFWRCLWDFVDVVHSRAADTVLTNADQFLDARWFSGARLNYAENLLRFRDEKPALISLLETGERTQMSYRELFEQTAAVSSQFKALGIKPGDRIAGWLPNIPQAVVAMLAATSLGAVWSSCSPDFGSEGALDRFGQIEPRLLIACNGYHYAGKTHDVRAKVQAVADRVKSVEQIIWVDVVADLTCEGGLAWQDLIVKPQESLVFAQLAFDAPLYILYSSGTTGKPKCIVHGAGGTLLQHMKEQQLHVDLRREDRLFFFTTCGWMMWNWLVSGLATGATLILYDGSPFHPTPATLWNMADAEGVTIFGISAKYLSSISKEGLQPRLTHGLTTLRTLISTGSPLAPETYAYIYDKVKPDVHLISMSGGTDIVSCFVIGNPCAPVYSGEIQCAGLGMDVAVYNDAGQPVQREKGELVCRQPFPCCPLEFWNDIDNERLHAAYFERFPGVWAQGDFAELTENSGYIIYGRSDAVLNPGGVRIGTAEIYRQLEDLDSVADAVCVGQDWDGDVRVVLFVVMSPGIDLDQALIIDIRARIRANASPRHTPARVIAVRDIPRTMSGKIAELAVRDVIHGRPVKNTSALANPEALECFKGIKELAN
ncbi:MAG: acetoacetate--CoA ligase [Proteobacteria bacterium]|nr:acetoacetate--CoA ligase [Pseudomonadota bacterium]